MGKYTTNPLRTGRENERSTSLETLGGEFGRLTSNNAPTNREMLGPHCVRRICPNRTSIS